MESMVNDFKPNGLPMLIGSQPLKDHDEATQLILEHIPQIPNWAQLPVYPQEGMVEQFMDGVPGLVQEEHRNYVNTAAAAFDDEMLAFFEAYLAAGEPEAPGQANPFALTPDVAGGFFSLLNALQSPPDALVAVKGQITGPITFCTTLQDHEKRAVFYNEALRDAAIKLLALKAAWQVKKLNTLAVPVILFIDEPALAGYGSSEFISISREEIMAGLGEVITAVHDEGAMAGVHVCANTDWSLLLESEVDIVNFDAHGYFDKLILYADPLKRYLASGRLLAWGLVPTLQAEQIESATVDSLWQDWRDKLQRIADLGIDADTVKSQSFITPSCGTGSLTPELSRKVLMLTKELSDRVRE
jgi:hypothetical protein